MLLALASTGALVTPASLANAAPAPRAAVTAISTTPVRPNLHDPVTVNIAFCVPAGSVAGDTFGVTVPDQLEPLTAGFDVSDPTSNVVAKAMVDGQTVTFTLTTYASTHVGICGTAFFQTVLALSKITPNVANSLSFTSGGQVYNTTVTPVRTKVPSPTQPLLYGTWAIPALEDSVSGTDALMWYVQAPVSPHPAGLPSVTFTSTAGAGQAIDCAHVGVQAGTLDAAGLFTYLSRYKTLRSVACTRSHIRLTTGAVPVGQDLRMVVATNVTSTKTASFAGSGTVAVGAGKATKVSAPNVIRSAAGGTASGAPGTPHSSTSPGSSRSSTTSSSSGGVGFAGKAAIWLTAVIVALLGLVGLAMRRRKS